MENYTTDDYHKGIDAVADSDTCYDKPDRKQKRPHYEKEAAKMMKKDNEFSDKKFQKVRNISNKKDILRAFRRIGRSLNRVSREEMPKEGYDKVCLILMNNINHTKHAPKIGALNDGYLFGLYHHRLGFKVFYLHNCTQSNYPKYLRFFLHNTTESLTVYYSGPGKTESGANGVEFSDTYLTAYQLGHVISHDNNGKCKVIFVSDCTSSGSVFDISEVNKVGNSCPSPMISISTNKSTDPDSKDGQRSHGILTYYFCKVIYDNPSIPVQRAVERINSFIDRFGQSVCLELSNRGILNDPIYEPCHHPAGDPLDEAVEEIENANNQSQSSDDESDSSSD